VSSRDELHVAVVVATYDWPESLDVVLRALSEQRGEASFATVVADDGSGVETARVVERWKKELDLTHVWQRHDGFRKARLLNSAALASRGNYLLFLDGDCVPRRGFVGAVRRAALPGWFVASKRLHLSPRLSERVLAGSAPVWRWSSTRWLLTSSRELLTSPHRQANRPGALIALRDRARPWKPDCPDFRPPYNGYGYAFGVSRKDFARVNGFDMRLQGWDADDTDLARRLRRAGLKCGWPGPDASVLHLWHTPRKQPARRWLSEHDAIHAEQGLRELAAELEAQESANRVGGSSSSSSPVNR
jgi:glycosyltransferase involved in cell wall biosynthesis